MYAHNKVEKACTNNIITCVGLYVECRGDQHVPSELVSPGTRNTSRPLLRV